MVEVTTNKEVGVWAGRRRFRLRLTRTGFTQVSLNMSYLPWAMNA